VLNILKHRKLFSERKPCKLC